MTCVLVLHILVTVFMFVKCSPEYCEFTGSAEEEAYCGKHDSNHILHFIPPVSRFILHIDMSRQPLKQLPVNAFQNLSSQRNISSINLQYCRINHIDAGAFKKLDNISTLRLSHNNITDINSGTFQHVKQIKYIFLDHNNILELLNKLFRNLALLEEVSLSYNSISDIKKETFKNTSSLLKIELDNNQLHKWNISFEKYFGKLTYLSLHGNPWICDCNLIQLYNFFIQHGFVQQSPACNAPPSLKETKWSNITRKQLKCVSNGNKPQTNQVIVSEDSVSTSEKTVPEFGESVIMKPKLVPDAKNSFITVTDLVSSSKDLITTVKELVTDDEAVSKFLNVTTTESDFDSKNTGSFEKEDSQDNNIRITPGNVSEELLTTPEKTENVSETPVTKTTNELPTTTMKSENSTEKIQLASFIDIEEIIKNLKWIPWTFLAVVLICIGIIIIELVFLVILIIGKYKKWRLSSRKNNSATEVSRQM